MKITRNTPEHLIVGENPVWVAVMLSAMGLIFTGVSLAMVFSGELMGLFFLIGAALPFGFLFIFVRRVQLIFSRAEGTLTVQRKNMRRAFTVVHPLAEVERAELETSHGDNANMHRVTLILSGQSEGRHPITQAYSNVGQHKAVHTAINDWLSAYRAQQD